MTAQWDATRHDKSSDNSLQKSALRVTGVKCVVFTNTSSVNESFDQGVPESIINENMTERFDRIQSQKCVTTNQFIAATEG